jgi:hypothetical protein
MTLGSSHVVGGPGPTSAGGLAAVEELPLGVLLALHASAVFSDMTATLATDFVGRDDAAVAGEVVEGSLLTVGGDSSAASSKASATGVRKTQCRTFDDFRYSSSCCRTVLTLLLAQTILVNEFWQVAMLCAGSRSPSARSR